MGINAFLPGKTVFILNLKNVTNKQLKPRILNKFLIVFLLKNTLVEICVYF